MVKAVFGLDDGEPPFVVFEVFGVVVQPPFDHGVQELVMGAQLGHDELQLLHGVGDGPRGSICWRMKYPTTPSIRTIRGPAIQRMILSCSMSGFISTCIRSMACLSEDRTHKAGAKGQKHHHCAKGSPSPELYNEATSGAVSALFQKAT